MRKILIKTLLLSTVCCLLTAGMSFAQEKDVGFVKRMWRKIIHRGKVEEKEIAPKKPVPRVQKELTKEEKIEIINNNLYVYGDEISVKIPKLVKKTGEEGNIVYKFKKESGEAVDFKDLDDETLSKLYRRVTTEAVLIRTERLNTQLQQLRQIQRPPQAPKPPPVVQPPKIYTPPKVPLPPPPPPRRR